MENLRPILNNREARMNFVNYWAFFVRTHSDKEWGEQQKRLINGMIQNSKYFPLTPQQYLKLKNEPIGKSCPG